MQRKTIPDAEIHSTTPEALIICYTPWVKKIACWYHEILDRTGAVDFDDLCQVGKLALLTAQKKYNPAAGASFLKFSAYYIRTAMRKELGIYNGKLPALMKYLDEPLSAESDDCMLDMLVDESIESNDERIERLERYDELHRAIGRLKREQYREIIRRVYFDGEDRCKAATAMGLSMNEFYKANIKALYKLKRDYRLNRLCAPVFHSSYRRFIVTHTSAVEAAVLWKEYTIDRMLGDGVYAHML